MPQEGSKLVEGDVMCSSATPEVETVVAWVSIRTEGVLRIVKADSRVEANLARWSGSGETWHRRQVTRSGRR